ncbi:MAG: hypothetical protein JXB05_16815 [Myxococcaceae bacterium]|nr:hypothetical protein [Myxococcaceae bacterium]
MGQKTRLQIEALLSASCGGTTHTRPTSVTAEVEGPGGQLIASQITLASTGATATLEFTPERPGPHHILVAFSEVGGLHQFDLHAAMDRSSEAPPQLLAPPCPSLERTLQGAWVCAPEVLRGDTSLGSFPNSRMAVAGDVIWVVLGTRVERYVDTGTELLLTGSVTHSRGAVEFLRASPDELIVLHGSALARYAFQNGALEATGALAWSRPTLPIMPAGPHGVLLREGDWLALGTRSIAEGMATVQVCPYERVAGTLQPTQEVCRTIPGEIAGFEPTVLWTKDVPVPTPSGGQSWLLRRWEWSGGQLVEQGSLVLNANAVVLDRTDTSSAAVPLVGSLLTTSSTPPIIAVATWSPQLRVILLEYLDPALTEVHASPTLYWTLNPQAMGQATSVRLRPPPP